MNTTDTLRRLTVSHHASREHRDAVYAYAEGAINAVNAAVGYVHTLRSRMQGAEGDTAPVLASLVSIEEALLEASGLVVTSYEQALETYPREAE